MSQLNNELFDLAMSEEAQPLMSAVLDHIRDNVDPITEEFFALNKEKEDRWSWHGKSLIEPLAVRGESRYTSTLGKNALRCRIN